MSIGPGTPEEFKKGKYTLGFVVYAFAIGLSLGGFGVGLYLNMAEVGGVRADMEKEDAHLQTEIDRLREALKIAQEETNGRMDRKVKNHEAIWHNQK